MGTLLLHDPWVRVYLLYLGALVAINIIVSARNSRNRRNHHVLTPKVLVRDRWDGVVLHTCIPSLSTAALDHTLSKESFSRRYALTAWRTER
jgi:hypothetical protein